MFIIFSFLKLWSAPRLGSGGVGTLPKREMRKASTNQGREKLDLQFSSSSRFPNL
jgi:hypothetical protein